MKEKIKIKELWSYLKIQDEEVLVVRSYNRKILRDEYLVARKIEEELLIEVFNDIPEWVYESQFLIVKQLGDDGKFEIPSADEMAESRRMDY